MQLIASSAHKETCADDAGTLSQMIQCFSLQSMTSLGRKLNYSLFFSSNSWKLPLKSINFLS
jgi:hypothetical protein